MAETPAQMPEDFSAFQNQLAETQKILESTPVIGMSSDGVVIVKISGSYEPMEVALDEAAKALPLAELQDKILEAMKDAKKKADGIIEKLFESATQNILGQQEEA